MRRTSIATVGISLLLGIFSPSTFATDVVVGQPKYGIHSEKISLDYSGRTVIFSGHAKLVAGNYSMTSDVLRITYGTDFREVRQIVARGSVRIEQGSSWATADQAVLDNHRLVLSGSPTVYRDGHEIKGSKITIHLSEPSNSQPEFPNWNDMPAPQRILSAE